MSLLFSSNINNFKIKRTLEKTWVLINLNSYIFYLLLLYFCFIFLYKKEINDSNSENKITAKTI